MPFWTYMLRCRDRTLYVGHTDDLDTRIAQHQQASFGGYTARKRPVVLVWSQEFGTRDEAKAAELRIKGWRKDKKLALIRGDWDEISRLSQAKGRPSTSSGQAVSGEVRARPVSGWLHPHPATLPSEPFALEAAAHLNGETLRLRYRLTGPLDIVVIPPERESERADGLWQHLCFEAFVQPRGGDAYFEINLSPSGQWAVYGFRARRLGMFAIDMPAPDVRIRRDRYALSLSMTLQLPADLASAHINLTTVLEEKSGHKSYWALAHPSSGPPDFHDPACFVLELPPASP